MKRILGILLLLLILCGCETQPEPDMTTQPPQTTAAAVVPTEPRGIYLPESEAEVQSAGAVRLYQPEADSYGLRMIQDDLLVFSGEENTVLTRYAGENLFPIAGCTLECRVSPEDSAFQISGNGITYFNPDTREVIFLDNDLKEVSRLSMPEDLMGKPVLSANRTKVYYCTAGAIRVYEMETGLDKLLKSISYAHQTVTDVLWNDTVLRCTLTDHQGTESTIFLSTQTGELLVQLRYDIRLTTRGNSYFAKIPDGIMEQLLFSIEQGEAQVLSPKDMAAEAWYLPACPAAVTAAAASGGMVLDYYDLSSGLRTGTLELDAPITLRSVESDARGEVLWLMGYDTGKGETVILQWMPSCSGVEDSHIYTGTRYTRENPDTQGLAGCAAYAAQIGRAHGIEILIGEDAAAVQPWDYTLTGEYQVPVLRSQLQQLENLLNHFPGGIFEQAPGSVKICVVRSIVGNGASGSVEAAEGLQFWEGDGAYVALAAGDSLERAFYHELFHILDGKILSDTRVYYYWHNLNPQGFSYFEDYTSYLTEADSQYLQEEDRAFIDAYSMCFPKEDRARIMEYACMAGNEAYFQSEIMQKKLQTLCKGIREAFGLTDETLLWEQYLKTQ